MIIVRTVEILLLPMWRYYYCQCGDIVTYLNGKCGETKTKIFKVIYINTKGNF